MTAAPPVGTESPSDVQRSDTELVEIVRSLPPGSSRREEAWEALIGRYQSLVRWCVQRYRESPESQEELMQVGYVGLLKAVNNFDPEVGANLAAYAQPCISGEIKRHFRDKRWHVHVKRSAQELRLELRRATAELTQRLARRPTDDELVSFLHVSDDELHDAQLADVVFQASSLDAPVSDGQDPAHLADLLGGDDGRIERTLDMEAVWSHWDELPAREQRLLMMRFYGNMTQAEIGQRLGISQMHVSRLLARALGYLRERILAPDSSASPAQS
jgi:RNA polymerase sigma-B factor